MMTSAQGFETSATFTDSSPPQDYSYLDDQTTPSNITPAFKTLRELVLILPFRIK